MLVEVVVQFKYLGLNLDQTEDDWPAVQLERKAGANGLRETEKYAAKRRGAH